MEDDEKRVELRRSPLGVVGGPSSPWNYPYLHVLWKTVPPALITGNTVVLKPSPYTPLCALRIGGELAAQVFPPGVFNIVTGGNELGQILTESPDVDDHFHGIHGNRDQDHGFSRRHHQAGHPRTGWK